ncbi:phosphatidate cytidylyltransferase [Candidatus Saccharibacteria bacterium]|nr:phosphatidate cytidylyltransferase [Candidatus Saccharibacteria bacterium]
MSRNFKVRLCVGLGLLVIALLGLYTFDGEPFRILYVLFSLVAGLELLSFFKRRNTFGNILLAIAEIGFLYCGALFILQSDLVHIWYVILGVPGYDVFAYLFGIMIGGKVFKESRPFPHISKNKTWEGTFCGLVIATALVAGLMAARGAFATDWVYLLCGPLALMGDLFESFLKRKFDVKDSNEIVIKNPVFQWLEVLVGGSNGHGGFLDRIDSMAFAGTVLLIVVNLM